MKREGAMRAPAPDIGDRILLRDAEAAEEAVIEWTLFWTPPDTGVRVATRGAEWYVFEGGLIIFFATLLCKQGATGNPE